MPANKLLGGWEKSENQSAIYGTKQIISLLKDGCVWTSDLKSFWLRQELGESVRWKTRKQ